MDIIDSMTAEDVTAFDLYINHRLDIVACEGCDRFEGLRGPTLCADCVGCWKKSKNQKKVQGG